MFRRCRRSVLGLLLSGACACALLAQNYQTSFSAVEVDRTKGPATWHGVATVEAATGAVNINLPLGPGIGGRGASFKPALVGSMKTTIEKVPGFQYWTWVDSNPVMNTSVPGEIQTSLAQVNFGPGYLELSLLHGLGSVIWKGPEGQSAEFRIGSANTPSSALLASADALGIISQFDGYESGWQVMDGSNSGVATPLVVRRLGTDGELVLGLMNPGSCPAITNVPWNLDGSGLAMVWPPNQMTTATPQYRTLPPRILVIKGDTAFEYAYQQTAYTRATEQEVPIFAYTDTPDTVALHELVGNDIQIPPKQPNEHVFPANYYDPTTGFLQVWEAYKAQYKLTRILNRHREWIEFTYPSFGAWTANWKVGGLDTGVSVSWTPSGTPEMGALTYLGLGSDLSFTVAGKFAYLPIPNNPYLMHPPDLANNFLMWIQDAQGQTSEVEHYQASVLPDEIQRWSPTTVTNVATGEHVVFSYNGGIPGLGVLTSVDLPGETVTFDWTTFAYRRNCLDRSTLFGGYMQGADLGYNEGGGGWIRVPRISKATGVTSVVETDKATGTAKATSHARMLPVPDWVNVTHWTDTTFYDVVTRPDKSVEVHRFVSPINAISNVPFVYKAGGPSDSTPDEVMQTMAHLKHQVVEIREYEPGQFTAADLTLTPGTGAAYRTTLYDRWDLRSPGNPGGGTYASATPYPTRTRVWTKNLPTVLEEEKLDWDATAMGWKTHRKQWKTLAAADSTIEYQSLASQGVSTPVRPVASTATVPAVRETGLTLSSNLLEWTFNRTDVQATNHGDATAGLALSAIPSLTLPTTTTSWDSAVHFTRVDHVQVGDASTYLNTQFTYESATGPGALHRKSAILTGAGNAIPPGNQPQSIGVALYGYDQTYGYLNSITPILPSGKAWALSQTNNGDGKAVDQTDANGLKALIGWSKGGRLSSIAPPNPEVATNVEYESDNLGFTIRKGPQTTHLRFNGFGQLIREDRQDAIGNWTNRLTGYDLMGRKTWETGWRAGQGVDNLWSAPYAPDETYYPAVDAWVEEVPIYDNTNGHVSIVGYTEVNHPAVAAYLMNPNSTFFTYDAQGRLILTQKPGGELVGIVPEVNGNGLITQHVLAPGVFGPSRLPGGTGPSLSVTTQFEKDVLGRLIKVTDGLGRVTTYGYDAADRILQVNQTDPTTGAAQPRSWEYDTLGRLTALVQPESGRTEYHGLTLQGKPTQTIYGASSASPLTVTTAYDELGRVLTTASSDASVNQAFIYDEGGAAALANSKLTTASAKGGVVATWATTEQAA